MISAHLIEPPLHGIFHLGSFTVGMGALPANYFEQMILSITDIVFDTAAFWVSKIIFDLGEPICSQLEGFLDTDYVQINTVARVFLLA